MRMLLPLLLLAASAAALDAPREWLAIGQVDVRGRRPFNADRVFERYLLDPAAAPPQAGEKVGDQAWAALAADEQGWFNGDVAYAYASVTCEKEQVVLARLISAATLFVNGDAFVGAVYGMSNDGVPVLLRKGENRLYVRGVRGHFRLEFEDVPEGLYVAERDATLPDFVADSGAIGAYGAVVVCNASTRTAPRVELEVTQDGDRGQELTLAPLPPLGLRKLPVHLLAPAGGAGAHEFQVAVKGGAARTFALHVRTPEEPRRRTFLSEIDGSVQEYSIRRPTGDPVKAGIVLTLHGAGVDAYNQARAYAPKEDFWIVAPTNRRPFGFDWQDWGRRDAYEALADALKLTAADPSRVCLAGHSMGGHGVWHLAANDPDRFRAIAPSAGWCSFDTYGGRPGGVHDALWKGADGASLTLTLLDNLVPVPTFILHGEKDDNVPLSEAQAMEEALRAAGGAPVAHVQPGVGHWWNGDASPGVDCVDWPGIFDLFRKAPPRTAPAEFTFVTADPGVDADCFWVHVEQPLEYGRPSRVTVRAGGVIETSNVRSLRLPPRVLDGTRFLAAASGDCWYRHDGAEWIAVPGPAAGEKSPACSGPFKRAFDHRFVLVYGAGDPEGLARARYDAQAWWYRGNGDTLVLSDAEFLGSGYDKGNVILYGNAANNRAFAAVLPEACPIGVGGDAITVAGKRFPGAGLGCLFVYPRKGVDGALVGVCGWTGRAGARLGYALLPFVSGVGYPDYAVFDGTILARGDEGVLAAGWFDHRWRLPAERGGDEGK